MRTQPGTGSRADERGRKATVFGLICKGMSRTRNATDPGPIDWTSVRLVLGPRNWNICGLVVGWMWAKSGSKNELELILAHFFLGKKMGRQMQFNVYTKEI